jgi:hypothetical protein
MNSLRALLRSGQSLLDATAYSCLTHEDSFGELWVLENLTAEEGKSYLAWKSGKAPPATYWSTPLYPTYSIQEEYYKDMASALEIVYPKFGRISCRYAACFDCCGLNKEAMPLVQAVMKLEKAGLRYIKEQDVWTSSDAAELETTRTAIAAARSKLEDLAKVTNAINGCIDVLSAKAAMLDGRVKAHKNRLKYNPV